MDRYHYGPTFLTLQDENERKERLKRLKDKRAKEMEKENLQDPDDEEDDASVKSQQRNATDVKNKFKTLVEKQRDKRSPREPKLRAIVHKRQAVADKKEVDFPAIENGKASQQSWIEEERKELIGLKKETEEMLRLHDAKLAEQVQVQKQRENYIHEEVKKRLQKEQEILFKKLAEMKFETEQRTAQDKLKTAMANVDRFQWNKAERVNEIMEELRHNFVEEMEERQRDYNFWLHQHSFDSKDQIKLLQELEQIRKSRENEESRIIGEMEKERELRKRAEAVLFDEKQKLEQMRIEMNDKMAALIQEQREREEKMKELVHDEVARFSRLKDSSGYGSYHSPRSFASDSVSERDEHIDSLKKAQAVQGRGRKTNSNPGSRFDHSPSCASEELRELSSPRADSRGSSMEEMIDKQRRRKDRRARNGKNWEKGNTSHMAQASSPPPRKTRGYEDRDMMFS